MSMSWEQWLVNLAPGSDVAIKHPTGAYYISKVEKVNPRTSIVLLENGQKFHNGHKVVSGKPTGSIIVPITPVVMRVVFARDAKKRLRWWAKWIDQQSRRDDLTSEDLVKMLKSLRTMSDMVINERNKANATHDSAAS